MGIVWTWFSVAQVEKKQGKKKVFPGEYFMKRLFTSATSVKNTGIPRSTKLMLY